MANYRGVYLGHPRLDEVMDELERRDALVALHPTSPPAADGRARAPAPDAPVLMEANVRVLVLRWGGDVNVFDAIAARRRGVTRRRGSERAALEAKTRR
jgi:hypothetical protein